TVQLTARTDIAQLGFIALALLLGRKIDSSAYPGQVPGLLDEFSRTSSPVLAAKLRLWLEKALQLSPRSFATADEAVAAISDLPDEADVQAATLVNGLDAFPQEAVRAPAPVAARPAVMDAPPERRGPVADRREPAKGKKTGVLVMALLAVVVVGGGAAYFMLPSHRSCRFRSMRARHRQPLPSRLLHRSHHRWFTRRQPRPQARRRQRLSRRPLRRHRRRRQLRHRARRWLRQPRPRARDSAA